MKKYPFFALIAVAAVIAVYLLFLGGGATPSVMVGETEYKFGIPKKSAHYESNTPEHGAVIPAVPVNVVIDFNFDLVPPSEIKITKDGKNYGIGPTSIDENRLAMRKEVDPAAPDGLYRVEYKACWPDRSCHNGHFEFAVDRNLVPPESFDLRGKKEVLVSLQNVLIEPAMIFISPRTKVIWKNEDQIEHFVNTDSHPAHTHYRSQNSRGLKKGETFSLTFNQPGFYPYHCSAHPEMMRGWIVVK